LFAACDGEEEMYNYINLHIPFLKKLRKMYNSIEKNCDVGSRENLFRALIRLEACRRFAHHHLTSFIRMSASSSPMFL
jgi:hypothetical protein